MYGALPASGAASRSPRAASASRREMLNSSYVAEIKIGQGAKPGEGGHLPGKKVSEKVAAARNAHAGHRPDLALQQPRPLLDRGPGRADRRAEDRQPATCGSRSRSRWCRTSARSALGIAKAGADIITLSGFEGGTGAARQHALRHVGLPSRHRHPRRPPRADGGRASATGSRSGPTAATATRHDIVKLHCLGANRVGFGTPGDGLARLHDLPRLPARHLPRRHRHPDRDEEEAQEHGLKQFMPRVFDPSVETLVRYFTEMGEALRELAGQMGVSERARTWSARPTAWCRSRTTTGST